MIIYFGLELDEMTYPLSQLSESGVHVFGTQDLLLMLESHLGLIGHPTNNQHLRIEQYRQALAKYLETYEDAFFRPSYEADQLATAAELLSRRDELLLEGWDFSIEGDVPERLQVLALIEMIVQDATEEETSKYQLAAGFADRFRAVLQYLETREQPITQLWVNEPFDLLPSHLLQLFELLKAKNVQIQQISQPKEISNRKLSDLRKWQQALQSKIPKQDLDLDGSLLIVKGKRETEIGSYLAQLFRHNPDFQPLCIVPEKNRALDNALIQESLPSLGILSASSARPSLQILKLVTTFLWRPINPYKILEFVTLSVKPLDRDLGRIIARLIADTPGMNSNVWFAKIQSYFEDLEERAKEDSRIDVAKARFQYKFWFERTRFDANRSVPKEEVIEIFDYLAQWADEEYEESGSVNSALLVLREQAKRIQDLLETLPESQSDLTALELERIVRTIYEPAPVALNERALGHLPYVYHPSAVTGMSERTLWWNFVHHDPGHFFSKWYRDELDFLEQKGVSIYSPVQRNQCALWQRKRPILQTTGQLILVIPEMVNGTGVQAHSLHGDLQAAFSNHEAIEFDVSTDKGKALFESYFTTPNKVELSHRQLGQPKAFIQVDTPNLAKRDYETFTSLESLFYYPYQWVFRYKIRLVQSSILSIVPDVTLMGNLSHRFFELLFKEDISKWTKAQVEEWIDQQAPRLFAREGAVLLMYGREPERLAFLNRIKYAAWSLVYLIQSNGWTVKDTELDIEGTFVQTPIRAKADLVLQRQNQLAVIDLKWGGANRRQQIIKNGEDLQLVMYAHLVTPDDSRAETAYFIIKDGKMIARNNDAFKQAFAVLPDSDTSEISQSIWTMMEKTYNWRCRQLEKGQVEVRTTSTLLDLEDTYAEDADLFEILEMKSESAFFDDYRTLINLVE